MIGGEFIKIADPKGVVKMRNSSSASHRLSESYNSRLQSEVDEDSNTGFCCCLCCCCGNKSKTPTIDASEPLLPCNESSAVGTKSTQKKSSDFAPSVLEKFISQNENDKTREVKKFSWFGVFSSANESVSEDEEDQSIRASMSHHSSHRTSVESSDGPIISSAAQESSSSTSLGQPSSTNSAALQQVMENHNKKIHATFPTLQPQGGYLASTAQDEPGGFSDVAN